MCLEISTVHHPDLEPLVAEEDIKVVKYLMKPSVAYYSAWDDATGKLIVKKEERVLRTPFMSEPVKFDENDECVMTAPELKHEHDCDKWIVEEGIHAYIGTDAFTFLQFISDCAPFHAYIPKGTKYYLGNEGDIVAEKMVIKNEIYGEEQR